MKALTLWQPWASLIFAGVKIHETRGFAIPDKLIAEEIAIHAAQRPMIAHRLNIDLWWLCRRALGDDFDDEGSIPFGAVLGVVRFGSPRRTESYRVGDIPRDDLLAGDWSFGRFAWPIIEKRALERPLAAKGKQGWWSIDL